MPAKITSDPDQIGRTIRSFAILCILLLMACEAGAQVVPIDTEKQLQRGFDALRRDSITTAITAFADAAAASPQDAHPRQALAYAFLQADSLRQAAEQFELALTLVPDRPELHADLGYLYHRMGRDEEAIEHLAARQQLGEKDEHVALQLAYLYQASGEWTRARRHFLEVSRAADPVLRERARDALAAAGIWGPGAGTWFTDVYSAPFFHTRHDNVIVPLVVRSGPVLSTSPNLQAYGLLRGTRDTQSSGGSLPQVYSDNVLVVGMGVRAALHPWALTLYAEGGAALPLVASNAARADVRTGVYGSRSWGRAMHAGGRAFPFRGVADLYYDVSYYSRFDHNVIGYFQARPGLRVLESGAGAVDVYGRLAAIADASGQSYNNVVEAGPGIRWSPSGTDALSLGVEYVQSWQPIIERDADDRYGDLRVMLTLSHYLVRFPKN